jgi:hypothetical protein
MQDEFDNQLQISDKLAQWISIKKKLFSITQMFGEHQLPGDSELQLL